MDEAIGNVETNLTTEPKKDDKKRQWIGTLNNPSDHGYTPDEFILRIKGMKQFKYLVFQLEEGENKTPHYQFYVAFTNSVRFSTLKKILPESHIDPVKYGNDNAREYCMKEEGRIEGPWEIGEFVSDVNRVGRCNKLNKVFKMAMDGCPLKQLLDYDASSVIKHLNQIDSTILKYKSEPFTKEIRQMEVNYIWGNTGTGKTYEFIQDILDGKAYRAMGNNPFDNYMGQTHLIYDEFGSQIPLKQFLGLTDIYPYELECRYSKRPSCFTKVTIISNDSILEQYKNIQEEHLESYKAFMDRFTNIIEYVDMNPIGTARRDRWRNIDKVYYEYDVEYDMELRRKVVVLNEYKRIRIRNGFEVIDGKQIDILDIS